MWILALLFGSIVGISLGLTGGGGSIFAVPLLVYGLAIDPRQAVGISLASVGLTALVGALQRYRKKQIEVRTGLIFSVAGMLGAPIGSWLSGQISESLLLALFAVLMLVVAVRMWRKAEKPPREVPATCDESADQPTCNRDAAGNLVLTSRCARLLMLVGLAAGVLAGLFGVGGGFVIVPALVLFSGMNIHRAVGTSLMVITLVSISGVASHLLAGRPIEPETTFLFVGGGVAGMFLGNLMAHRISGPALQKVFAVAIVAVALFVITKTLA